MQEKLEICYIDSTRTELFLKKSYSTYVQVNLILVFFFSEFQHLKITKLRLSKSQLTSNVLNSFLPSFKNLTYLDLRSNSLTSFTNTILQIMTIDIG